MHRTGGGAVFEGVGGGGGRADWDIGEAGGGLKMKTAPLNIGGMKSVWMLMNGFPCSRRLAIQKGSSTRFN